MNDLRDSPNGMTLRDYFAGQALIAYLPRYYQLNATADLGWPLRCADLAARSYEIANAMLAERLATTSYGERVAEKK